MKTMTNPMREFPTKRITCWRTGIHPKSKSSALGMLSLMQIIVMEEGFLFIIVAGEVVS
jgi:hypothetical protein